MSYDPISEVVDQPLAISPAALGQLKKLRTSPKLLHLPGVDPSAERARLSAVLDALLDSLVVGIFTNPTKLWVMKQFQKALVKVEMEDTEGREHVGTHMEQVMDILGIESSDGLLSHYLGGI